MDSYLSSIDSYIKEEDERRKQQQLFYLQQEQQQQQNQHQQQHQHQQQQQQQLYDHGSPTWSTSIATNPYIQSVMTIPQPPMYTSNIVDYQPQTSMSPSLPTTATQSTPDPSGTPVRIRKKPGRRPNPASPAHRKEQNRAAQRAFRERKERRLLDLESALQTLQEQHHTTCKELKKTKHHLEDFKSENGYLKGVILTLQFMCMHHNIGIPPHSPYLSEETLAELTKTHPHSVKAYVKALTQNEIHRHSTSNTHLSNESAMSCDKNSNNNSSSSNNSISTFSPPPDEELDSATATTKKEGSAQYHETRSPAQSPGSIGKQDDIEQCTMDNAKGDIDNNSNDNDNDNNNNTISNTSAIQHIRLQLRVQSTMATMTDSYQPSQRLQPTPLQQTIAHDQRIDLIPCPQMRDRLIIFRDQMDYDHCFNMILNSAVFQGGDPTLSQNWELPPLFYSEYWFLCSKYDLPSSNDWYQTKHVHSNFPSHDSKVATTWPDGDSYASVLASSMEMYGMDYQQQQQQQQQHPLYDTSLSPESLVALSHLRL